MALEVAVMMIAKNRITLKDIIASTRAKYVKLTREMRMESVHRVAPKGSSIAMANASTKQNIISINLALDVMRIIAIQDVSMRQENLLTLITGCVNRSTPMA